MKRNMKRGESGKENEVRMEGGRGALESETEVPDMESGSGEEPLIDQSEEEPSSSSSSLNISLHNERDLITDGCTHSFTSRSQKNRKEQLLLLRSRLKLSCNDPQCNGAGRSPPCRVQRSLKQQLVKFPLQGNR